MKVKESSYLMQIKPVLRKLTDTLLAKYEYVSVLASDSSSKRYSVSKTGTTINEDSVLGERGYVIKIYHKGEFAEYSFSEISDELIPEICNTIENGLIPLSDLIPEGAERSSYKMPEDEPAAFNESSEYEIDPEDFSDEEIIRKLTAISEAGRAYDSRIVNCSAIFTYQKYTKIFLSRNKDMVQNVLWSSAFVSVMAGRDERIESAYSPISMLGGAEVLNTLEEKLTEACDTALELLNSEPVVPGEYDCICTPDVTGMIVHEAFGHGVEMDMFVKDRALAKEYIGKYVASPLITMHDGAATVPEVASYFFDDEGVLAHDTIVIDKGILKQGICDSQAAMCLGVNPTGNGRRESTKRKAYTRMTNTIFEAGESTLDEMIASIDYGFLLSNASSGMEDPKNWGIQCAIDVAREIKDGKLTGKIFSPIIITGYVPDLLKSISMVSDGIKVSGGGFCGKGHKEWVKVSDGGPYIKAKIRLG